MKKKKGGERSGGGFNTARPRTGSLMVGLFVLSGTATTQISTHDLSRYRFIFFYIQEAAVVFGLSEHGTHRSLLSSFQLTHLVIIYSFWFLTTSSVCERRRVKSERVGGFIYPVL
jgi:hypothetical protein